MSWNSGSAAAIWIPTLNRAEVTYGIPKDLLARQCYEESGFNPEALNAKSGCIGLMQLLPKDFPGAGENPTKDIFTGAQYMEDLFGGKKGFKDWQLALAAYDWGPGNLRKWQKAKGTFATLLPETQNYVSQIINDVPVQGVLCKTPSLLSPLPAGNPPSLSPSAPLLGSSSGKSLFSRVTSIFRSRPVRPSASPSAALSPPSAPISFPINPGVKPMSTPNPILVAAAPAINNVLDAIDQFGSDIGANPEMWKLTVLPSLQKLLSAVELQIPVAITAEGGQLQTLVSAKVAELKAKLAAAIKPVGAVAAAPASTV
jgi:hypothetical protein